MALRGVNLGGWLIIEKWMTPGLFEGTSAQDEYSFMQTEGAHEKIEHHRNTFITEADFKWMKKNGVTAVRIPVGYWILDGDGPYTAHLQYLDWTMKMVEKYSLQAIIDLHGLKGSQNGNDHSGRVNVTDWYKYPSYRKESVETLVRLAKRYKDHTNFWGLQITNEPKLGLFQFKLRRYYKDAYRALAPILKKSTRIIFSDGFTPRLLSGALGKPSHPVVMDVHMYHMTKPFSQYFSLGAYYRRLRKHIGLFKRLSKQQPLIIGEWNGVMRQVTLNKIPQSEHEALVAEHIRIQQEVFETTEGWFYWNYKHEKPGVWDFRSQVEAGVIKIT